MPWAPLARRAIARRLLVFPCLLALGCDASRAFMPHPVPHATRLDGALAALFCIGDLTRKTPVVTCAPVPAAPASGGVRPLDVTVGRQNIDVTLTASAASYNAVTDTFKVNITVKNLLAQAIGTPDGTTNTKVRVFFSTSPAVTAGSGTVTVVPDSVGTFTSAGQPYYIYNLIAPQTTSALRSWKFVVPAATTKFTFSVYVSGKLPSETGVVHWTTLRPAGISLQTYEAVWTNSPTDIFAAGLSSAVAHYNGTAWSLLASPGLGDLQDVFGFPGDTVWVVGSAGARGRWNGAAWTTFGTPAVTGTLYAVWGTSTANVFAVGDNGTILHFTGAAWTAEAPPASFTGSLRAVWGTSDGTIVYAVGLAGAILERVSGAWVQVTSPTTTDLRGLWGTGAGDFYAVGTTGHILHTSSGLGWSLMTSPVAGTLKQVNGTGTSDIYAAGDAGAVVHYNGTTWSVVPTPFVQALYGVTDGGAGGTTWAVGQNGTIFSYNGTAWTLDPASGMAISSIWASGPSDVWAAGVLGVLLHYNGTSWTMSASGVPVNAVWGSSSSNVFGVGNAGNYSIYNGSGWTTGSFGTTRSFHSIWGTGSANVYTAGDSGSVYRYNGTSWSSMSESATLSTLNSVWGSDSNNVFAVGAAGAIVRYQSGLWSSMTSGTTAALNGVSGVSPTTMAAVGDTGKTLSYANVGTAWTTQAPAARNLRGVWAADSAHVYAVGVAGAGWAYNGSVWYVLSTGVTSDLSTVYGTSATNVYVGGLLGVVLVGTP
jgi:hypothetical protein